MRYKNFFEVFPLYLLSHDYISYPLHVSHVMLSTLLRFSQSIMLIKLSIHASYVYIVSYMPHYVIDEDLPEEEWDRLFEDRESSDDFDGF